MGAIGSAITGATPYLLPITLGAGLWQMFNQPEAQSFNMQPQSYSSPQGQNIYNPATNSTVFIPSFDPSGLQNYWQNQLLRSYAVGGLGGDPYSSWRSNIESEIGNLNEQIQGAYTEGTPLSFQRWYRQNYGSRDAAGPGLGGWTYSAEADDPAVQAAWEQYQSTASQPTLRREILQEQVDAWGQELAKLEEILKQTGELDWRYGSITGGPSEGRIQTFSDLGGSLEEILGRTIEDQRASALTELARRGNLGGSAEAAVAGQTARAQLDARAQRLQFQQNLEAMDYNRMIELINFIDSGGRADLAQQLSSHGLGQSVTQAMASIDQARQFAELQAQQWQQNQIAQAMAMAGNTIGYLSQPQGGFNMNQLAQLMQMMQWLGGNPVGIGQGLGGPFATGAQTAGPIGFIPPVYG